MSDEARSGYEAHFAILKTALAGVTAVAIFVGVFAVTASATQAQRSTPPPSIASKSAASLGAELGAPAGVLTGDALVLQGQALPDGVTCAAFEKKDGLVLVCTAS